MPFSTRGHSFTKELYMRIFQFLTFQSADVQFFFFHPKKRATFSDQKAQLPGVPSDGKWKRIPRGERFEVFAWEGAKGKQAVNGSLAAKDKPVVGEVLGTKKSCGQNHRETHQTFPF